MEWWVLWGGVGWWWVCAWVTRVPTTAKKFNANTAILIARVAVVADHVSSSNFSTLPEITTVSYNSTFLQLYVSRSLHFYGYTLHVPNWQRYMKSGNHYLQILRAPSPHQQQQILANGFYFVCKGLKLFGTWSDHSLQAAIIVSAATSN